MIRQTPCKAVSPCFLSAAFISLLFAFCLIGCEDSSDQNDVSAEFNNRSSCQNENASQDKESKHSEEIFECVAFHFDSNDLKINHTNCLLNCCPDPISITAHTDSNVIEIVIHSQNQCNCVCLFNLEYEVRNLLPGSYLLRIAGGSSVIEFDVDLFDGAEDVHCFERINP